MGFSCDSVVSIAFAFLWASLPLPTAFDNVFESNNRGFSLGFY